MWLSIVCGELLVFVECGTDVAETPPLEVDVAAACTPPVALLQHECLLFGGHRTLLHVVALLNLVDQLVVHWLHSLALLGPFGAPGLTQLALLALVEVI